MFQLKDIWRECEIDIMYNFMNLPVETREVIERVEGKPGFVKLPYDQIYPKYIEPFLPKRYTNDPGFVPVSNLKFMLINFTIENLWRKCVVSNVQDLLLCQFRKCLPYQAYYARRTMLIVVQ